MSRAAAPSTGLRGGLSGAARTAGVPLIGAALTPTSPMTSADQTTFTPTSALATGCENLRGEEDLYHKKRNGGEGVPGLRSLLTPGNSVRGTAAVQPEAPPGRGKAAELATSDSPEIPTTRGFEGAEKKAFGEEPPQDTRAALPPGGGTASLGLKTLVLRRVLMCLRKRLEAGISGGEAEAPHEEEGRVCSQLLTSSHALKDASQTPGMETESQGLVMNISVTLPALIIPLMTVIPQPAENAPLLSKAWTWHPYRPASALGTMGLALQSTETWTPLLKTEEAKAVGAQDLPRECQNPGVPALWMETTTMDTTEMNLLGALQAVAPLLEVSGVAVTGVEEAA